MFWKQPNSSSQSIRVQQIQQQHTQHELEEKLRQANAQSLPPSAGYSWDKAASQSTLQQKFSKNINISPQKGILNNSALANSYESDESIDSRILPPNFETNIRQLELAIEANPDIELDKIKELIMLYTLAVEYYDSNNDDKFIYYKNKIVYLHQQDNVIKAMNKHILPTYQSSSYSPNESQKKLEQLQFSARQAEGRDKIKGLEEKAAEGVTDEDVNQIMDTQDSNVLEQEMVIEKDLKKQTNLILKRLNQRMKTKTKCSTPPFNSFRKIDDDDDTHNVFCRTESDGVEEAITNGKSKEQPLICNPVKQVKKKIILNTREKRQKFSISVIDTIVSNFIADKKQSLSEEKKLKIDLIEFEYEKLLFQIEKNLTMLTEEERNKIERDKDHKIFLVEDEFYAKEQQEINIIQEKYANKTFPKKDDQVENKQD